MPLDAETLGPPGFRARKIVESERYKELDRLQQYYESRQHDKKGFDFDGRPIPQGIGMNYQPLLSSSANPSYVPLRARRPSSPFRLAPAIVNQFTNMIFGEERWPTIGVADDAQTEDFYEALTEASSLEARMIRARNIGGSTGSVGIAWRFHNGKPRVEVLQPKHIYIHTWADRDELIPEHVIQVYRYPKDEWDEEKRKFVRNYYWFRRDWTPDADVHFHPVLAKDGIDPEFVVDEEASGEPHGDGFAHFVWIQNRPSELVDGISDYDGQLDALDTLDLLYSVLGTGTIKNLDPTLVLRMNPMYLSKVGVKKGSDNALVVGETGDASYLEMGGSAVQAGIELFNSKRRSILETCECVIPDPNEIVASGMSSVAMKIVYLPMISRCQILRTQYGDGIKRLLRQMMTSARAHMATQISVLNPETGQEELVQPTLDLPPRVEIVEGPPVDEFGNPMLDELGAPLPAEKRVELIERHPGSSENLELVWGKYFPPTPDDQTKIITNLTTANGGAPVLSHEASIKLAAQAFDLDADEELKAIMQAKEQQKAEQAAMFAEQAAMMGGQVPDINALPPGAETMDPGLTLQEAVDPSTPLLPEPPPEEVQPVLEEQPQEPLQVDEAAAQQLEQAYPPLPASLINSALALVNRVKIGELTDEEAIWILVGFFGFTEERARALFQNYPRPAPVAFEEPPQQ